MILPPLLVLAAAAGARGDGVTGRAIDVFVTGVLVLLGWIDLERRIVPNLIVVPAAVVTLATRIATEPSKWPVWIAASLGAAAFFLIAHAIYPIGLGMGDVKLALLIGASTGAHVLVAFAIGTGAAGLFGIALLIRQGAAARKATLPFAPFLAFGTIAVLIVY